MKEKPNKIDQKSEAVGIQDMGKNTSKVFYGEAKTKASQETYNETPGLLSNEIRKRLPSGKKYTIGDIESFKGELVNKLLQITPEYDFHTIAVDINERALSENNLDEKIIANAENLPFKDNSIDVSVVRFVLQWNFFERQKKIIKEIARTTRKFALIEHAGSENINPNLWRQKINLLFSGEIPKLKRGEHFFSSRDEIEKIMAEENIKFERIKEKVINNLSDVYTERYGLDIKESKKAKAIMGNKDFFVQTDWIIYPSNQ